MGRTISVCLGICLVACGGPELGSGLDASSDAGQSGDVRRGGDPVEPPLDAAPSADACVVFAVNDAGQATRVCP